MTDIKKFCKYLYNATFVPVYLYEKDELIDCFPAQGKETYPPSHYLSTLETNDNNVTYVSTSFHSYYGRIRVDGTNSSIVIGPINDFPYSDESLVTMKREFSVDNAHTETFSEFFHWIPTQNLSTFINSLIYINYTLNQTELTRDDLENNANSHYDPSIDKKYSSESYDEKEEGIVNYNVQIEREFIRYIETGNVEKLNDIHDQSRNIRVGIIASNNIRQWKNTFIVSVTLSSRAAMRAGVTPSIAYHLSNIYIQQVERLSDVDSIISLLRQVQLDYAKRVANSVIPATADNIIHKAIQYVRHNTNKAINVSDVADHVGFTRSHLSRKFKQELGIELSGFIRKCKLEEAKDLLTFSNKSISEISNYLCFSSQSHFQKSFKDSFGITPKTYRNSA